MENGKLEMCLWKFSFLALLFFVQMCFSSLSLSPSPLSQPLWFIFHRHLEAPSHYLPCLTLFFSHSCSASACLSGLEKTQQKEGMESCGLELHAYTQIMVGRRSSRPRPTLFRACGQQTQSTRGFYGTPKAETLVLGGCGPDLMRKEDFMG